MKTQTREVTGEGVKDSLVFRILEFFSEDAFKPSKDLAESGLFDDVDRKELSRTIQALASPKLVERITDESGKVIMELDIRYLVKDAETRGATYKLSPFGTKVRDHLREQQGKGEAETTA